MLHQPRSSGGEPHRLFTLDAAWNPRGGVWACRWSLRVMEEFFNQGDREKEEGLPITPLCDRGTTSLSASQINFLEFIVVPLFLQVR